MSGGGAFGGMLYNCMLTRNGAGSGGGVHNANLYNCVAYYNTALNDPNFLSSTLDHCCTTPDPGGTGNITNEPMFVDREAANLRLLPDSPCVNTGTNQDWMTDAYDLDGKPRIYNGTVDMGAYEWSGGLPAPAVISASDGVYADRIEVTWSVVDGATEYEVWRGDTNDLASAAWLADIAGGTSYPDASTQPDQRYYYWVRAVNVEGPGQLAG